MMRKIADSIAAGGGTDDALFVSAPVQATLAKSRWNGHPFVCCLTHDVDHLDKYVSSAHWIRRMGADLLRRGDPAMMARRLAEGPRSASFRRDINWLLETEKKMGVTASYFFLAHERPPRGEYVLSEAEDLVRATEEAGMEVGLHASLGSSQSLEKFIAEKARLDAITRRATCGVRQHYLDFSAPETWRLQARAGFLYDCTFGDREKVGARGGAIYPFRPVDPETGEEIGIWEIPLTVMDGTLAQYMKLSPEEGLEVVKREVTKTAEAHGVFCLLWHNSSLDDVDWRGWRDVYLRILDFIQEQNAWIAGGAEIVKAWESRQ